jgi:uncharacterized membrane protein
MSQKLQKYWHKLFKFSVLIKGFTGVWETASGFLFLFLSKATLGGWLFLLVRNELVGDPNDRFINFLTYALQNLSNDAKIFAALYVLAHGLLNIFLVIQLYRNKHWAYLVIIWAMIISMPYEIYRISLHHSATLTAITIFDAFFILLAWREYKFHKSEIIS